MKRQLLILLAFLVLPAMAGAQTTITAAEIVAKINKGEAVNYSNATVTGHLDLTQLQNKTLKPQIGNNGANSSREYISTVTAPVSFTNCIFKGDVLAYFNPDNGNENEKNTQKAHPHSKNEVYNTNFEKEVRFEKCVFEQQSAFKYSEFKGRVSFAGSTFQEEALFKYSKFKTPINFSYAKFREAANFKYVEFPELANFSGADFAQEANFKYSNFTQGVDFQKASFAGLANFKYAKLADPVQWKGATFTGEQDLKYTQVNNESFSAAALKEKAK